ncbi:AI-2E family transporter [Lottiidibacillus patelloidae]|uniref:AI-2E family transporter n=1 Tax=Lottiidibacillus patelloidae TaxID=2670334 RepID=A0A263BWW1_9BACI|nr:AI-2E family transporter [Lottiidibacillus patelloidae]OZM57807.1 AI-2E family transporter [Lottiidibacillus patelloidae]
MTRERLINHLLKITNVLLLLICIYVFLKLAPLWKPVLSIAVTVLTPFFIAALITYLLHPIVEKLRKHGLPRPLSIIIIYSIFFGGTGYALFKGIPYVTGQLKDLNDNIPTFVETYRSFITNINHSTDQLPDALHERIHVRLQGTEAYLDTVINTVINSVKGIFNSLIIIAIIPFVVFYLLKDYPLVEKVFWYFSPRKYRRSLKRLLRDINHSLGSYIRGQLIVCLLIGILATISLWLAGISYPVLLGIIIGLTNIIPYFGPILGAIPAVIIAFTVSIKSVIIVIVIIFGLQFVEGNLLSPLIVGKSLHMHPILIIFALLLGGEIAGIIGLILAVPFLAVAKVIVLHTFAHYQKH